VQLNPKTGTIVVLESVTRCRQHLAGEWVFWQTGYLDFIMLTMRANAMLKIVAGAVVLMIGGSSAGGSPALRSGLRRERLQVR
jgi:hypothetical protein